MRVISSILLSLAIYQAECRPGRHIRSSNLPVGTNLAPCAQISASASATLRIAPKATPTVTAQLAYECLTSVPLNQKSATELVQAILPYIEWQSDLSYLKRPPPGYLMPGVHIKAELHRILNSIKDGKYTNEHAFQMDLYQVFLSVHDGHFRFTPDLLGKTVQFRRPVGLVSVSRDGFEIPKIYVESDIKHYVNVSGSKMPPVVSKINGMEATTFIFQSMAQNAQHDPDAQYNMMMYGKAYDSRFPDFGYKGLFSLGGRLAYFYPGPNTTIQFENGVEKVYDNYATVIGNFEGVTDGPSMYEKFCTGPKKSKPDVPSRVRLNPSPTQTKNIPIPPTETEPVEGYPIPHLISSDRLISGYFLDDPQHQDVAVLVIFSFQAKSVLQFQSLIETLIADSKSRGKTKLIIDLSSNSGGNLLCGYDAFRQFFPTLEQPGYTRFRSSEALKIISKQISDKASTFSLKSTNPIDYDYYQTPFNYRFDLNVSGGKFLTYEDKFNGRRFNDDEFTSNMKWDLEDSTLTSSRWGAGMNVTGYGNRTNFTQPFKPEDIVLLHDGVCASTCAIFSEFMHLEAGVRSVAMGGRPNREVIQGIGGTKGANSYTFSSIHKVAHLALDTGTPEQIANWTSLTELTTIPMERSTDSAINVRDHILKENLNDGIPAQFIYEPADCRLYFEPDMITDVQAVWKKVASTVWGHSKCVSGSMNRNSKIENDQYRYMRRPPHSLSNHATTTRIDKDDESQRLISKSYRAMIPFSESEISNEDLNEHVVQ